MARRALLIGIDSYQEESLKLDAPKNDVAELSRVLGLAGYAADCVRFLVDSGGPSLSTNTLRKNIRTFFNDAVEDDELLLYISAHGSEQSGHRLIIPSDYDLADPASPADLVGDQFLYGEARKSKAKAILIVIDACREGVRFKLAADPAFKGLPATTDEQPKDVPTVVILYSCSAGENSYAEKGVEAYSYFTRAFCNVLKTDDELATLKEIKAATQKNLTALLSEKSLIQNIAQDERPIIGKGGQPAFLLVKENFAARIKLRITDSLWCQAVQHNSLWSVIASDTPELGQQLLWLVLGAEDLFKQAQLKLPNQRWRDERAPERVLQSLHTLLGDQFKLLNAPEIGLAVAVIYLYEAALAAGELQLLTSGNPLQAWSELTPDNNNRAWHALRNALQAEEALQRRYVLLQQQEGSREAAEDLAAWQLCQFLHGSGEMWEYTPQTTSNPVGWINGFLHDLFKPSPLIKNANIGLVGFLDGRRLLRLARLSFAGEEDIELECQSENNRKLEKDRRFSNDAQTWPVNEVAIAHLLNLAFALAADPRRMTSVLAEHLGRPSIIKASSLRISLAGITWQREQDNLALSLECFHQVVDFAVEELLRDINHHRQSLNDGNALSPELLHALPRYFDDEHLRAQLDGYEAPLYQKPHLRLSMDQGRVRELLMGQTLYGKPELALRELYQNALDACRYRRARLLYLKQTGKPVEDYSGQIVFRTGYSEQGRAYVECQDNGIGMGERQLRTLFARAGQRFTDSHEFHVEKAQWEEQGIHFWPNSRFGIGVFSYFMLADELQVETKRLKHNGVDQEAGLRLQAVGSGSLFRLQQAEAIKVGTRVRLYLNHVDELGKLLADMLEWLWLPEFETLLVAADGQETRLLAGQPTPGFLNAAKQPIPVLESAGECGQVRLFWNIEGSADAIVLVDGIKTKIIGNHAETLPSKAVVINLSEELRPILSVDRTQILSLGSASEWLAQQIRGGAYRYISENKNINLVSIGRVFNERPLALFYLDRALRAEELTNATIRVPVKDTDELLLVSGLGFSPFLDYLALDVLKDRYYDRSNNREYAQAINCFSQLPERTQLCGWLSARIAALLKTGYPSLPIAYKHLSEFANHKAYHDYPSLGLLLLLDKSYSSYRIHNFDFERLDQIFDEWKLLPSEIIELARPLALLGGAYADVESVVNDWQKTVEERNSSSNELFEYLSGAETITPAHFGLAALRFKMSLPVVIEHAKSIAEKRLMVLPNLEQIPLQLPVSKKSWLLLLLPKMLRHGAEIYAYLFLTDDWSWAASSASEFKKVSLINSLTWARLASALHVLNQPSPFTNNTLELQVEDVIELARPLKDWGIMLPDFNAIPHESLASKFIQKLCYEGFNQATGTEPNLTLPILGFIGNQYKLSPSAIVDQAQILSAWGVHLPDFTNIRKIWPRNEKSWALLSLNLDNDLPLLTQFTLQHLAHAALAWTMPLDEVIEIAKSWVEWGVELPDFSTLSASLKPEKRQRAFFIDDEDDETLMFDKIELAHVFEAAERWDISTDAVIDMARPWAKLLFHQTLPATPFDIDVHVKHLVKTQKELHWSNELTAWDLAVTAARYDDENPANYCEALLQLKAFDVDITDALEFAEFCLLLNSIRPNL